MGTLADLVQKSPAQSLAFGLGLVTHPAPQIVCWLRKRGQAR
jgi:hypothetical protein